MSGTKPSIAFFSDQKYRFPPVWLETRSSKWTIGSTAFLAAFTDGFLYGAVVPVLPFSLTKRSGVPESEVQFWLSLLLTVFGIFLGAGAPIAGWFADRGSRSTPFLWGLILAIISTVVFCFARAPGLLVLGRVLQGLAASVIYTAGLALVADAVGADEIGAWMGFVFSGNTFGLLVSPFLAGIVYDHAGYYAVFGVCFGVFGVDLLLRAFMIEKREAVKYLAEKQEDDDTTYQPTPQIEEAGGNAAAAPPSSDTSAEEGLEHNNKQDELHHEEPDHENNNQDKPHDEIPNHEPVPQNKPHDPEPPPGENTPLLTRTLTSTSEATKSYFSRNFPKLAVLARSPRLIAAIYGCLTHTMLLACIDSILPLFVKRTFDWTATGAGTIFLTISCPSLFGTVFGALADRYGSRLVSLSGLALTTLNLGLMGLCGENSLKDKVLLCVFLVLAGIGLNLILAPLAADVFATVDALAAAHPKVFGETGAYAQAYSLMTGALGLGTALGPILAGSMYENTNWPITVGFLAILCALPSVGVFFFTGGGWKGDSK